MATAFELLQQEIRSHRTSLSVRSHSAGDYAAPAAHYRNEAPYSPVPARTKYAEVPPTPQWPASPAKAASSPFDGPTAPPDTPASEYLGSPVLRGSYSRAAPPQDAASPVLAMIRGVDSPLRVTSPTRGLAGSRQLATSTSAAAAISAAIATAAATSSPTPFSYCSSSSSSSCDLYLPCSYYDRDYQ